MPRTCTCRRAIQVRPMLGLSTARMLAVARSRLAPTQSACSRHSNRTTLHPPALRRGIFLRDIPDRIGENTRAAPFGPPSTPGTIMRSRRELANAIRALSMDAVQAANSGHPGMPMGMADIAEVLWNGFLSHNPANPKWFNRDRFVLSNGHGSMLQYALLHLTGFDLPMDQLKRFRQLHSKTAGHPEASETPGVETTTRSEE